MGERRYLPTDNLAWVLTGEWQRQWSISLSDLSDKEIRYKGGMLYLVKQHSLLYGAPFLIRKLFNFYGETTKLIYIFKHSAPTSQRTNSASITTTNRLTLLSGIRFGNSENHKKPNTHLMCKMHPLMLQKLVHMLSIFKHISRNVRTNYTSWSSTTN